MLMISIGLLRHNKEKIWGETETVFRLLKHYFYVLKTITNIKRFVLIL